MTERLHFFKLSGSGNDFIIVDNFQKNLPFDFYKEQVTKLCNRNNGIGADGLIVLNHEDGVDFRWDFFNSDGSIAEMCGNGSRCAARLFSRLYGKQKIVFQTLAGLIHAEVNGRLVKVKLSEPSNIIDNMEIYMDGETVVGSFVNTGVPHFVVILDDVNAVDVKELGRKIRFHERFNPAGTNVNFVQKLNSSTIKVRTYERGVEDETLACGTGASASAVVCGYKNLASSPVKVITSGGEELTIYFTINHTKVTELFLEGEVKLICEGDVFLPEL